MPSPSSIVALRRVPTPLLIVAGLHLAVLWALLNGLQVRPAPAVTPGNIIGEIVDTPLQPPLDLPPPTFRPNSIRLPVPPERFDLDTKDEPNAGTPNPVPPPLVESKGSGTAEPEPIISAAAVDPRHPLTQPPYPLSEIRSGSEGALLITLLVGVDGRVRDAKVSQSSGFERLDQAALTEAKQHWHLRPATRNGAPFEQWLTLKVVFRLKDR